MSPEARPEAVAFEPGSGALPSALEPAITESDNPILLLVASDTGDAALRTAIALAEARGANGQETVLADASTQRARLHELLGVENLEGLADVFLFGASVERVRTRPSSVSFDFIPVGAYVPEPAAVLESSRWNRIARELVSEGARMFVFVPGDSPGLGLLSKRAGQAVLIGDAESTARAAARLDPSCEVEAVVDPTGAAGAVPPAEEVAHEESELSEPVVFRADRRSRRAVSPVLLILLVAAAIAAVWFGYNEYLAAPAVSEPVAEPVREPDAAPREPVPEPEPVETPIPYSVAVAAYDNLDAARERLAVVRSATPSMRFYLAPLNVQERLFYRLLAGPVTDQAAAEQLMDRLVEEGHKTAVDAWAIRPTRLAFELGEYESRQAAATRVDELEAMDIPTYIVPVRYEPGPDRYRVYGGAFESEADATVMREMLTEAGVEAPLVERIGVPVTPS